MVEKADLERGRDAALRVWHLHYQFSHVMKEWAETARHYRKLRVKLSRRKGMTRLRITPTDRTRFWFHEYVQHVLVPQLREEREAYAAALTPVSEDILLGDPVVIQPNIYRELWDTHTAHSLLGEILRLNLYDFPAEPEFSLDWRLLRADKIVPTWAIHREYAGAVKRRELLGSLERPRRTVAPHPAAPSPRAAMLEDRNRELYEMRRRGESWEVIARKGKSYPHAEVESISGVKAAIKSYIEGNQLEPLPPGKGGRPKKTNY